MWNQDPMGTKVLLRLRNQGKSRLAKLRGVVKFMEFLYIGKCRSCDYAAQIGFSEADANKVLSANYDVFPDFMFYCVNCKDNQRHEKISFERCASC